MKKNAARRAVLYELISKPSPTVGTPPPPRAGLWRRLRDHAAAPAADAEHDEGTDSDATPRLRLRDGCLTVPLASATYVTVAGVLVAMGLLGYTVGRSAGRVPGVAAPSMTAVNDATSPPANPLLDGGSSKVPDTRAEPRAAARRDLHSLGQIKPPQLADSGRPPAAPAAKSSPSHAAASKAKSLHLWIESIRTRNAAEKRAAEQEAARIQAFLSHQGVGVAVQSVENGVKILSEEGFPPGAAGKADRDAFETRVRELGRLYRQQGGRYSFKDCFFPR